MQKLELDRQRFNVELEDMIARKEIERGAMILDKIRDYQITMAKCATSISESLGKMTIELRRQAHDLMEKKKRDYIKLQRDAIKDLKKIYAEFPEGSRALSQTFGGMISNQIRGDDKKIAPTNPAT